MQSKTIANQRASGFTLVELIVVIIIVGVIGTIALPRFFDSNAFSERGFYEELAAALNSARAAAVATGCPVRFVLTGAGYSASQQQVAAGRCDPSDATWPQPVTLADGSTLSGATPSGVSLSGATTITFDALGGTGLGSNHVVAVGPYSLAVNAASGYVETS